VVRARRLALTALCLSYPFSAFAAEMTGYEIAKKGEDMNGKNYKGQQSDAVMELYGPDGQKVVAYKLKTLALEGTKDNGDITKSLIRFLDPPDSKGTALLTYEKKGGGDADRWLYLSETRQVKQIAASSKSAAFKGSEFAYEDMGGQTIDQYEYKLMGDAKEDNIDCYKVEVKPKYADSGYSKLEDYFDKQRFIILRTDFYDKAGKLLKTATFRNFKQIDGQWRGHLAEMNNVQTKRKTIVKTGNYKLGLTLSDNLFTVSQLQKE
jgi:outer membrane lipoprotein-sorting protein